MTLCMGELFAGYGGLGMGIEAVLGGVERAWVSEFDPAPSKILDHHWPNVPNLGDITKIDWSQVEPVDILTGGFPCQDVSIAGARKGMGEGTRSGLWSEMARAVDALRPRLVVIENVRGLLSTAAGKAHDADLEYCQICVGDGSGDDLRALGAVLGDLADLGFDAEWGMLKASDVGAPHGRARIFIVAWPAVLDSGHDAGSAEREQQSADETGVVAEAGRVSVPAGLMLPTPTATYSGNTAENHLRKKPGRMQVTDLRILVEEVGMLPTPDAALGVRGGAQHPGKRKSGGHSVSLPDTATLFTETFGDYAPAVERWAGVLGRPAPQPLATSLKGGKQLNPAFVEWMMGLPHGHVTAPELGLSRVQQLRVLGNGVVPQQAATAVGLLLDRAQMGHEGGVAA